MRPWQRHFDNWLILQLNGRTSNTPLTAEARERYANTWAVKHGASFGVTLKQVQRFAKKCILV